MIKSLTNDRNWTKSKTKRGEEMKITSRIATENKLAANNLKLKKYETEEVKEVKEKRIKEALKWVSGSARHASESHTSVIKLT